MTSPIMSNRNSPSAPSRFHALPLPLSKEDSVKSLCPARSSCPDDMSYAWSVFSASSISSSPSEISAYVLLWLKLVARLKVGLPLKDGRLPHGLEEEDGSGR